MSEYDRFNLRFPDGMRERLAEAASKADRSLHAEIIERLRLSFETPAIESRLAALEAQVAILMKRSK